MVNEQEREEILLCDEDCGRFEDDGESALPAVNIFEPRRFGGISEYEISRYCSNSQHNNV